MFRNCFTKYFAPDEGFDIGGSAGAEELELAEPVSEEGAEEPEFAEPVQEGRTEADSAFAELRRRAERAEQERENAILRYRELEQQNSQMSEALGLYFEGENPLDLSIAAQANYIGADPDEVRENFVMQQELEAERVRSGNLEEQLMQIKVEQAMAKGLSEIQAIDPTVKDLNDLGDSFARYIAAGLSSTDAYFAVKAQELKQKKIPPAPIGTVQSHTEQSGFFSKEDVDAMSDEDIEKNYDAIMKSMKKWK